MRPSTVRSQKSRLRTLSFRRVTSSGPAGSSLVLPAGCVSVPDAAREVRARALRPEAGAKSRRLPAGGRLKSGPDAFPVGGVRVGTHVARDGVQLDQLPGREADAARGGVA